MKTDQYAFGILIGWGDGISKEDHPVVEHDKGGFTGA
tara:strand:+ start:360 stop:470 length:111 start_codon:yes stop_codon:yes gene_type:complete